LFYAPKDLIQKENHDLSFSPNSILDELSDFVLKKKKHDEKPSWTTSKRKTGYLQL